MKLFFSISFFFLLHKERCRGICESPLVAILVVKVIVYMKVKHLACASTYQGCQLSVHVPFPDGPLLLQYWPTTLLLIKGSSSSASAITCLLKILA